MLKNRMIFFFISFIIYFLPSYANAQKEFENIVSKDTVTMPLIEYEIDNLEVPAVAPANNKVQYISQLTRYGFRNLFTQFNYNSSQPYSRQINPHAELYIQDYLKKHTGYLTKMRTRAIPYFNLIDQVFGQYGLPRELKYLAVIESNLQTEATSWAGAVGPWQFMPETARLYGLTINSYSDERRDYIKSTHAAARYLLFLYKQMHDWLLVIAAYNGGPGRVYDAMKKSGSRNFWELQYYLPQESRNHVKKFIATHYIMEANENNAYSGIPGSTEDYPIENNPKLTEVELQNSSKQTISGKYNAKIIAQNIDMTLEEFNRYNPMFDIRLSRNGQYDLVLPEDKMNSFLANKYTILNESIQQLLGQPEVPNTKTVYPKKSYRKKGT